MWTSSQVQKDILEPLTKKLNKQVYSLQKQCFFHTFFVGTGIDPALDIGIAKSGSNLVHSHPSHILCLTPCVKARKSFHGVLLCCKSFSISEDQ